MKRTLSLTVLGLTAFLGGSFTATAHAAGFTIFVYETAADIALRTDTSASGQAYWGAYAAFGKAMQEAGVARGGAPLMPAAAGKVVAKETVTEGAYGKAPLQLGGYFQIDVPDEKAALAWAARAPSAQRGGAAEVRAHLPTPGM